MAVAEQRVGVGGNQHPDAVLRAIGIGRRCGRDAAAGGLADSAERAVFRQRALEQAEDAFREGDVDLAAPPRPVAAQ
jgi:hypothetical protein